MRWVTEDEAEILILIRSAGNGVLYPRDVETKPPAGLTPQRARIALQGLVDTGDVKADRNMKLVIREAIEVK